MNMFIIIIEEVPKEIKGWDQQRFRNHRTITINETILTFDEFLFAMNIKQQLGCMGAGITLYAGATLAVNVAATPIFLAYNGLERAVGRTEQTITGRAVARDTFRGPNGEYYEQASFVTPVGDTIKSLDRFDLLEGKYFPNQLARSVKVGDTYTVRLAHSFAGNNLLRSNTSKVIFFLHYFQYRKCFDYEKHNQLS